MAAERGREDVMMAYDGLPDYEGDVEYETWRRGGNPDLVDRDLETSRGVAEAITNELKKRHNAWLETQAKAGDIFAPQEESRG